MTGSEVRSGLYEPPFIQVRRENPRLQSWDECHTFSTDIESRDCVRSKSSGTNSVGRICFSFLFHILDTYCGIFCLLVLLYVHKRHILV